MTARSIHLPSLNYVRRLLDDLDKAMQAITDENVTTLHRRVRSSDETWQPDAAETVTTAGDGYPGGTLGGGSTSACNCDVDALDRGETVCPHGSSTERAALGQPMADPVLTGAGEFFAELAEFRGLGVKLERRLTALLTVADDRRGRQTTVDTCRVCSRTITGAERDKPRQGACQACYAAFRRWGKTADDPSSWESFIRQTSRKRCDLCGGEGFIVDRYDYEQRPCPSCSAQDVAS